MAFWGRKQDGPHISQRPAVDPSPPAPANWTTWSVPVPTPEPSEPEQRAEEPVRVLVTGSRDWLDHEAIWAQLDALLSEHGHKLRVVHGKCPSGADAMAGAWCATHGVDVEEFPADWQSYGAWAEPRRYAEMIDTRPDLCLAFVRNGSDEASGCTDLAEVAGIKVIRNIVNDLPPELPSSDNRKDHEIMPTSAESAWPNLALMAPLQQDPPGSPRGRGRPRPQYTIMRDKRILEFLRHRGRSGDPRATVQEISEALHLRSREVYGALGRLATHGEIFKPSRTTYAAVSLGVDEHA